jgi:ABC-type polysaccharide/polyol phosphate transport system ATPase subunit
MLATTETPTPSSTPTPPSNAAPLAISVHGVGKMHRIYDSPQDRLKQMLWRGRRSYGREFWALRDISFEVRRGEAVGIIGRNGSGKSTLLQIIAGTMAPTEGEVQVSGSVAALLELGSGFNPEFTGRENVYLNGAILGIERAEIERRFDDIAAFADIGQFIDQAVKTYSSGMVVRLAFAVAASIDPEILIVDEALSVGDVYFQHRCMRRIKQLVDAGTTLLFVSHATETVKRFCQRGVWLDSGVARYIGEAGVAVERYLAFMRMREVQDRPDASIDEGRDDELGIVEGSGTTNGPLLVDDQLLPQVVYDVDLANEGLFLQGQWGWAANSDAPRPARFSTAGDALAGFRYCGDVLDLFFLRGPDAGAVQVQLDDAHYHIDLSHPSERGPLPVHFAPGDGDHRVLIRPSPHQGWQRRGLYWLGGRVAPKALGLTFHRDPALHQHDQDVERYGTGKARITAVELLDYVSQEPVSEVEPGQRLRLRLHAERLQPAGPRLEFSYIVRDRNRIDLFGTTTIDEHILLDPQARRFVVEFAFDVRLGPGSYSILAAFVECSEDLTHRVPMDQIDIAYIFTVTFNPARPVWYVFHEPTAVQAIVYAE